MRKEPEFKLSQGLTYPFQVRARSRQDELVGDHLLPVLTPDKNGVVVVVVIVVIVVVILLMLDQDLIAQLKKEVN